MELFSAAEDFLCLFFRDCPAASRQAVCPLDNARSRLACRLLHQRMLHTVAVSFEEEQMPVMDKTVNHRRGHLVISKYAAPFREFQIGSKNEVLLS